MHRIDRWFPPCLLGCLLAFGPPAFAHPMHFHLQPLDAETIECTLDGMDRMVALLESRLGARPVELPEGAMGVAALSWVLPREVATLDEATLADSESLNDILEGACYDDPETAVYDWKIDAERILEAWEVLARDLDIDDVDAAFIRLDTAREDLGEAELLGREIQVYRDRDLVRTTSRDLELIEPFAPRIENLLQRLGAGSE